MSGVNYRGRARLRDQQATERLSALLDGVAARAEEPLAPEAGDAASSPQTETGGPQHREPVAVRTFFSRPAIVVLVAVLLVVCGISALSLWQGDSEPDSSVVVAADATDSASDTEAASTEAATDKETGRAAQPSEAPGSPGVASDAGSPLTIHVVGEVKKPAVVQLSPGARMIDAVEAAGGLTDAAVTERINLAQPLTDGQQVLIPNAKTAAALDVSGRPEGAAPAPPAGAGGGGADKGSSASGGTGDSASGGLINLNTATAADFEELPRVGPVLAQRIVDFRTEHGPFTAPEQLDDVSGIGPAMLDALLPLVTV